MKTKLIQPPVRTNAPLSLTTNLPVGARRLRRFNIRCSETFERRSGVNAALQFAGGKRGVALVITLILLVVITTLAVAFLALSHRETVAVSSSGSTLNAELAADAGFERGKAQMLGQIAARNTLLVSPFVTNNDLMGPEMMVSVAVETNRLASLGMFTNPSPPVFIWTNKSNNDFKTGVEDRFWLDLNRNLQLEPTGYIQDEDETGNLLPTKQWRVGDPQWIGLLRDPNRPHGPDNPFIARYAYLILPAGRSLDINWIHNQAIRNSTYDGYFRNQGVGAWEMNLPAFLADVNPNYWNSLSLPITSLYQYGNYTNNNPSAIRGQGVAFDDAREILNYRFPGLQFGNSFGNCRTHFSPVALTFSLFPFDATDIYCNGPVVPFGSSALSAQFKADNANPNLPWPGSRSAKNFYTVHDLWKVTGVDYDRTANNPNPPPSGFVRRLKAASARRNTEDRYTFYRILAQLDTDSTPERDDRLNINYRNLTNDFAAPIPMSLTNYSRSALATNLEPWNATDFFHSAVDRLLTNEFFPYGITNVRLSGIPGGAGIPVFTNGSVFIEGNPRKLPIYSPRIQQLLQMTLNIYEATTNDSSPWPAAAQTTNLPTVLRPVFERQPNGDIYITRYVNETGNDFRSKLTQLRWYELGDPNAPVPSKGSTGTASENLNFYDIPILFGARKGVPNFNEFTMNTVAQFSRKLQVEKDPTGSRIAGINQMLIMSISNSFICEFWNSYSNYANAQLAYPRQLEFSAGVVSTSFLTNNHGFRGISTNANGDAGVYAPLTWSNAYRLTKVMTNIALPPSIFYNNAPNGGAFKLFDQNTSANNAFERLGPASTNRWGLTVSNRVLCFLFDNNRLIDSYSSARMNSQVDLSKELDQSSGSSVSFGVWDPVRGISNQIAIARGDRDPGGDEWINYRDLVGFSTIQAAKDGFKSFMDNATPTQLVMQAGFSPRIRILQVSSWEADDPLVHYTAYDLVGGSVSNSATTYLRTGDLYNIYTNNLTSTLSSPGYKSGNKRYNPWGGPQPTVGDSLELYRFAEKDPGTYSPDQWDFPLQKFPSLGWLGRVHRGTPWQTVYFKAPDPSYTMDDWRAHTGAAFMPDTFPTNDWRLLDVFTAAIHPNATRGRLSINQTNPAAWSAVFASVPITAALNTGSGFPPADETVIQPMSVTNGLAEIVENINLTRSSVFKGQFKKLSEFMMVTNLTIGSPYFSNFDPSIKQSVQFPLMDSDYERLPQQILSLVKLGEPRYVVYSWGQSLKPADYVPGIGIGVDASTKLTRNYQITGELATRAVVRVEFERDPYTGRSLFNRPHAVVESFNILPNE